MDQPWAILESTARSSVLWTRRFSLEGIQFRFRIVVPSKFLQSLKIATFRRTTWKALLNPLQIPFGFAVCIVATHVWCVDQWDRPDTLSILAGFIKAVVANILVFIANFVWNCLVQVRTKKKKKKKKIFLELPVIWEATKTQQYCCVLVASQITRWPKYSDWNIASGIQRQWLKWQLDMQIVNFRKYLQHFNHLECTQIHLNCISKL